MVVVSANPEKPTDRWVELIELPVESLKRESDLAPPDSFVEMIPVVQNIQSLFNSFSKEDFEKLPEKIIFEINQNAHMVLQVLGRIMDIDRNSPAFKQDRVQIIRDIIKVHSQMFKFLCPIIAFFKAKQTNTEDMTRQVQETIDQKLLNIDAQADEKLASIKEKDELAQQALRGIQKAAGTTGVTKQAEFFKESEKNHFWYSVGWLVISVLLGAAIVVFAYHVDWWFPGEWRKQLAEGKLTFSTSLAQILTSRVIITAIVMYLFYFSIKNYLAHRHNGMLDRHRVNALKTYQAIYSAAGDETNRGIILAHAASCIFDIQNTGFTGSGKSDPGSDLNLVNLVGKAVTPKD